MILVNNYQPPKEKTLEDFTREAREKVKHLELHALPMISHQTIIDMLKGKVFSLLMIIFLERGLTENMKGFMQALCVYVE